MSQGVQPIPLKGSSACAAVQLPSRRCMDASARDSPSLPPSASAKRSLQAAIDSPPERPDPGRPREHKDNNAWSLESRI
eukprot:2738002-Pleurochrysis_carterae.AAC.1